MKLILCCISKLWARMLLKVILQRKEKNNLWLQLVERRRTQLDRGRGRSSGMQPKVLIALGKFNHMCQPWNEFRTSFCSHFILPPTSYSTQLSSAKISNQCICGTLVYERPSQVSLSISGIPHRARPVAQRDELWGPCRWGIPVNLNMTSSKISICICMCEYLRIKLTHMIKLSGWHVPWKVSGKCDRARHWDHQMKCRPIYE